MLTTMVVIAAMMVASVSGFMIPQSQQQQVSVPGPIRQQPASVFTTTQLHLKVKVDPEASKKDKINPGAYKGAAYGGSIAIAILLPVAFLVYAFIH
jgi:hypothetical protein